MPGIKGLWSLRSKGDSPFDKYLVQSYIGETRVLAIEGEEMGEVSGLNATVS
jgi:DNA damage-binding protein 1